MDWWTLKETILDIIYPDDIRCALCGIRDGELEKGGVCLSCLDSLPFIVPPICPRCGKPVLIEKEVCPDCRHIYHAFYQAMSILEYRRGVPELIYRYKYKGERHLARPMIEWMTEGVKRRGWDFELIVPVPLHRKRQKKRGFNQAAILAWGIGRNLNRTVIENNLIRLRNTPTQVALDKHTRMTNLKKAFGIRNPGAFEGKPLLLIDDVYTTGATVDQCTRILLEAGAARVYVLTLATGRNI